MNMISSIGFFGDSFCAVYKSKTVTTYIEQLAAHYGAKITNVGKHATSIGDLLLLQLNPVIDNNSIPDVSVFVWTDPNRLFNRKVRGIGRRSSLNLSDNTSSEIWRAAKQYYTHLHDWELTEMQYIAMMRYVDSKILPTFADKTKIIHMWSFANFFGDKGLNEITYHHRWETGVEIRPPLHYVASYNEDNIKLIEAGPNHLTTQSKNDLVFNWIKEAIDNYESGKLIENIEGIEIT